MLARVLFDDDVRIAEADPATYEAELHPDEAAQVAQAIEKRRLEYATGRGLVRTLLRAHGGPEHVLRNDDERAPVWPSGWTGTISHTKGYCGVALARTSTHRGLGLDAEPLGPLDAKLFRSILRDEERAQLEALPADVAGHLAKLAFSAKESAYKAQYALTRTYLGFSAMRIEIDDDPRSMFAAAAPARIGAFRAVFARDVGDAFSDGDVLHGRFRIGGGYVLTGVAIR